MAMRGRSGPSNDHSRRTAPPKFRDLSVGVPMTRHPPPEEARALVEHREEGRAFLYRAQVAAEDVNRSVGSHLVERLFEGSLADAVSHLLTSREVSRAELDQLEKLIKDAKRRVK